MNLVWPWRTNGCSANGPFKRPPMIRGLFSLLFLLTALRVPPTTTLYPRHRPERPEDRPRGPRAGIYQPRRSASIEAIWRLSSGGPEAVLTAAKDGGQSYACEATRALWPHTLFG